MPAGRGARAAAAVLALGLVLTACGDDDAGTATAEPSASQVAADCAAAADAIVASAARYLDSIEATSTATPAGGAGAGSPSPAPADTAAREQEFSDALSNVRAYAADLGCDPAGFRDDVTAGLEGLTAGGPVANAVLLQLRADADPAGSPGVVPPGGDVAAAVAAAPAGAVVGLAAGEHVVAETLVLLRGVTLRGAGRDATQLRSAAGGGVVLVLTGEPVALEDLTLTRPPEAPGSVLSAAPAATVSMTAVRVSGARADAEGEGGIGVLLAGGPGGQTGLTRRTTLRLVDSEAVDNAVAGVVAGGEHRVDISGSLVSGSGQCGICFLATSDGTVTGTRLEGNLAGVVATGDARPVVEGASVTGGDVGVQALERAAPQVTASTVAGSARAAFLFADQSTGLVRGTTCQDVEFGVVVAPQAAPEVGDNPGCRVVRGQ